MSSRHSTRVLLVAGLLSTCTHVEGKTFGNTTVVDPTSKQTFYNDIWISPEAVEDGRTFINCRQPGMIALTYDNAPHQNMAGILDKLKEYKAKATFFANGFRIDPNCESRVAKQTPGAPSLCDTWPENINQMASLLRRAITEGHQIGNGGYWHRNMLDLANDTTQFNAQITELQQAAEDTIGSGYQLQKYFRPPFGEHKGVVVKKVRSLGYTNILYSIDSGDYNEGTLSPQATYEIAKQRLQVLANHSSSQWSFIVSLHADKASTHTLIPLLADLASKHKYRIVSLSDCIGDAEPRIPKFITEAPTQSPKQTQDATGTSIAGASSVAGAGTANVNPAAQKDSGACGGRLNVWVIACQMILSIFAANVLL
eukprot:comp23004_c0_seq1/m.36682 comp23004_c0_seq1/g.36682  ORF comp23004_c0_seq1/g.36682 comp23004_c0_seq1/m.36682 type:complete len:369 (-) comp23004_c0_seq1:577-1683(-)